MRSRHTRRPLLQLALLLQVVTDSLAYLPIPQCSWAVPASGMPQSHHLNQGMSTRARVVASANHPVTSRSFPNRLRRARQNNNDDNDDGTESDIGSRIVQVIDTSLQLLSQPLFLANGPAVGIPLALLLVVATSPLGQGLLTLAIFVGLAVLGRNVVLDDVKSEKNTSDSDDDESLDATTRKLDVFALVAAVLTGLILVPSSSGNDTNNNLLDQVPGASWQVAAVLVAIGGGLLLVAATIQPDNDARLEQQQSLRDWDLEYFDEQNRNESEQE